jgi:membrane-associated phospholipid phosphatase
VIGVCNRGAGYLRSVENEVPWSLKIELTRWQLVLACLTLLMFANLIPAVHREIIGIDTQAALFMNALIGTCPVIDRVVAWLNTKMGDVVVLFLVSTIFFVHSLSGSSSRAIIRRLSFWGWLAVLCLTGYALEVLLGTCVKRDIPLLALSQLKNVQTIYGITLRTDPLASFPSGHATAYMFFALMAWPRFRRMSLFLLAFGVLMLSTRLIVGVHWLSDMLLGALPFSMLIASLSYEPTFRAPYALFKRALLLMLLTVVHRFPFLLGNKDRGQAVSP